MHFISSEYIKLRYLALWILLFLLIIRLVAMYLIPLNDPTEARYSEIARIMVETNNWVTPMHQYNVPFLAKPPLSIWLSALFIKAFGVSALNARLPSLLLSIAVLGLIWQVARQRSNPIIPMMAITVLAGNLAFYLDAGTVMTDPSLLFCTTLTFVSFWESVVQKKRLWGYVFFIALALGLLSKGLVAFVLSVMPIALWCVFQKKTFVALKTLPCLIGILLIVVIAFPWYYLAEMKNPGFLNYFIIGEHFSRFLEPSWQGDKYGFAHQVPYGMIWIYALLCTLPWCVPGIVWLFSHRHVLRDFFKDTWMSYWLFCALVPLVFFTFARNIVYPYVFPSLPALALLFAECTQKTSLSYKQNKALIWIAGLSGLVFFIMTCLFIVKPELVEKSQYRVVQLFESQHPDKESRLIYWGYATDYSAEFYSGGKASATFSPTIFCQLIAKPSKQYVVIDLKHFYPELPSAWLQQMTYVGEVKFHSKEYQMYLSNHTQC